MADAIIKIVHRYKKSFLFLTMLFTYSANLRIIEYLDLTPATYMPISILSEGNFELSEFTPVIKERVLIQMNGEMYSIYPVLSSLVAVPVYLIPYVMGEFDPVYQNPQPENVWKEIWYLSYLGKFTASILASLSVVVFYCIMNLKFPDKNPLKYALIFGLGTSLLESKARRIHNE